MGECHCSNIAIMQLFHELKQQFPALPDHVVAQCIAQNSYDREICTKSLQETQQTRPSPGAFPPPAPSQQRRDNSVPLIINNHKKYQQLRANRPVSLDIDPAHENLSKNRSRIQPPPSPPPPLSALNSTNLKPAPFSAPPTVTVGNFFDDLHQSTPIKKLNNNDCLKLPIDEKLNEKCDNIKFDKTSGFEVNVNVACSPSAGHIDKKSIDTNKQTNNDSNTRSYTSVSLTLRPPSSDPQAPIDIRSKGSSLTYSSSSLDPRGFQSRLQISISPANVGSVASTRIRPTNNSMRPNSLIPVIQEAIQRPTGLPTGNLSQLSRPTMTMSAPTTPSAPTNNNSTNSLPTTPSLFQSILSSDTKWEHQETKENNPNQSPLNKVSEQQRELVFQQLIRKDKLAKELKAEKVRLETMKKELQSLSEAMKREQRLRDPLDRSISPETFKRKIESDIYQLQEECKILTAKVDKTTDPRVPLGETNEEFYQGIYTGQTLNFTNFITSSVAPPPPAPSLPSVPPVWQIPTQNQDNDNNRDGPSWVCRMCTFNNHPLMDSCEQCDMLRFSDHDTGETQDIHIRVTHHHNFPQRSKIYLILFNKIV
ncbi:mitogen-activated protein kinase kinase kinase 7-interacting protein 3 homolog isoform X2 [Aphidius gifuensis]|uniref:mitogen-activated protein kinase kinase kinase 7-interacting protein 3 homolog isoform X2 n=1 Tax=Aphidius gifuensis TaxID=684658 RepID=UPI001CDD4781|nr:mitogen-activated protein kinase kinase kinase 7-interacting protein 3 homolog isoform X2 [Aphidius gifuensis]